MLQSRLILLALLLLVIPLWAQSLPEVSVLPLGPGPDTFVVEAVEVGDVDGDGQADVAVHHESFVPGTGPFRTVDVFSGVDNTVIRTLIAEPLQGSPQLRSIAPLADLNGDEHAEVGVFIRGVLLLTPMATPVQLRVFDGASGAILWTEDLGVDDPTADFPPPPRVISDLDGDGLPDVVTLLISAEIPILIDPNGPVDTRVRWFKGTDGTLLHDVMDPSRSVMNFTVIGDVDGDGHDDLAFGAPESDYLATEGGAVALMSGATRQYIHFWGGSTPGQRFGDSVGPVDDRDGDGVTDVGILSATESVIRIYSGATRQWVETIALDGDPGTRPQFTRDQRYDWDGEGVDDHLFRSAFVGLDNEVRSGVDFSLLAATPGRPVADRTGDLTPETMIFTQQLNPLGPPVVFETHRGARAFGAASGALELKWSPIASTPAAGRIVIEGGPASGTATLAASFAPASPPFTLFGVPVLLSPVAEDLISILDLPLDAQGRWEFSLSLRNPAIDGTVVYLQAFAATPAPSASAGLELLFDD